MPFKSLTQQEFLDRAVAKHGDRYDYTKSIYVSSNIKISIICPTHGQFEQRAYAHYTGRGCVKCTRERTRGIKRPQYVIDALNVGKLAYLEVKRNEEKQKREERASQQKAISERMLGILADILPSTDIEFKKVINNRIKNRNEQGQVKKAIFDENLAWNLLRAGYNSAEIGNFFGFSGATILKRLKHHKNYNEIVRTNRSNSNATSKNKKFCLDEAVNLLNSGLTLKEVSINLGVKSHSITRALKRNLPNFVKHPRKYTKMQHKFLTFDELQREVNRLGISTQEKYNNEYRNHAKWPASPDRQYKISWRELFGKTKPFFLSFSELQKDIKRNNIDSPASYRREYIHHRNWPSCPAQFYKRSWRELFGRTKPQFLSFLELKAEVVLLGIHSEQSYRQERTKHINWPFSPPNHYKCSWRELFGKVKPSFISFNELSMKVKSVGITTQEQYRCEYRKYTGWPATPRPYNRSWRELLGK